MANPKVFFDITISGRVVMELYEDVVPKTVKNFLTLCTDGVGGRRYKGSSFHRVINNFMLQGGDVVTGDGTGSTSIYGARFGDENFTLKHTAAGDLSMANSGRDTNGCQFLITTVPAPWLDGRNVVFGKVTEGIDVLDTIQKMPTTNDRPDLAVVITDCGKLPTSS